MERNARIDAQYLFSGFVVIVDTLLFKDEWHCTSPVNHHGNSERLKLRTERRINGKSKLRHSSHESEGKTNVCQQDNYPKCSPDNCLLVSEKENETTDLTPSEKPRKELKIIVHRSAPKDLKSI